MDRNPGGGLNPFDRESEQYTPWRIPPGLESAPITALTEDSDGHLWVGTSGGGAHRPDRATAHFTAYRYREDDPHSLSSDFVTSIAEDAGMVLWLGTANGGLNALPPGDRSRFIHYRHEESDRHSLGSDHVNRILEDSRGRLWIGTGQRLDSYDRERQRFEHHRHAPNDPGSLIQHAGQSLGGKTRKFICRTPGGESLRVKYYEGPGGNREVFASVAATRLLWILGFDSDSVYPVMVNCLDCPEDPWTGKGTNPRAFSSVRWSLTSMEP